MNVFSFISHHVLVLFQATLPDLQIHVQGVPN